MVTPWFDLITVGYSIYGCCIWYTLWFDLMVAIRMGGLTYGMKERIL